MKVMIVFGTRPEAIKMCPVVKELRKHEDIQTVVCVSGQHKEMLQQVLNVFEVVPQYNLEVMKSQQTLFDITILVLGKMKAVLERENPDLVLVHGDTTTAYAAALASFYLHIPVGHVEAGLRTYNVASPFPEEYNRQSIDSVSQLLFAPTEDTRQNLIRENKNEDRIFVTGNTVIDALRTTVDPDYQHDHLKWADGSRLVLVTAHRRENLGRPMANMFQAIRRTVDQVRDIKVVYPVHLNPAVREMADKYLGDCDRIRLIEPLDVIDFHNFMAHSYLILTDSGGVQEEAPSLGKPVLVMRDTTERPEGVRAGTLRLVGTGEEDIYKACMDLLNDKEQYMKMSCAINPYGDGHASEKIVQVIMDVCS